MPTWAHRYFAIEVAHDKDYVASVISYYLDLTGPSEVVQAACASSLVAVARGVQAIRLGLCDVALCGGASFSADDAIRAVEGMIWSPEGTCKPYADDASGTVPADGAAIVVITSRPCARTYAEVRGVAVNNDGRRKSAFSQPSCEAQVEVVRAALANAKTSPAEVDYIEGHGTGTKIGDQIELQALAEVHARLVDASPSACTRQPWDGSRNGFRPTGAPHAAYRFAHRALGRLTRARRSHARAGAQWTAVVAPAAACRVDQGAHWAHQHGSRHRKFCQGLPGRAPRRGAAHSPLTSADDALRVVNQVDAPRGSPDGRRTVRRRERLWHRGDQRARRAPCAVDCSTARRHGVRLDGTCDDGHGGRRHRCGRVGTAVAAAQTTCTVSAIAPLVAAIGAGTVATIGSAAAL